MKREQKGFTLVELLIVMAIIGVLAALAVPIYRMQTVKAKLAEVTLSMGHVASGVASYYTDMGFWPPPLNTQASLKATLGVDVPIQAKYINAVSVDPFGKITFTIQGTNELNVDGNTLSMVPNTSGGGLTWTWSAGLNFPETVKPKN